MTRFILYTCTTVLLAFSSCKKENSTPDNCNETKVTGIYNSVMGTTQAPGQGSGQALPSSESSLTIIGTICNVVQIGIGSTIGSFEANCISNGNTIVGTSADNNSNYTYDTVTKVVTVKYVTANGITYNITGKK